MLVGNKDGAQFCVGERRANESDILHARQADIADKLAAPAQEAVVLLALNRGAYALIAHLLAFLGRDPRQVVWLASRSGERRRSTSDSDRLTRFDGSARRCTSRKSPAPSP